MKFKIPFPRTKESKLLAILGLLLVSALAFRTCSGSAPGESLTKLNVTVPAATQKKEDELDKMALYKKAQDDSMRLASQKKKDSSLLTPFPTDSGSVENRISKRTAELHRILETPSPLSVVQRPAPQLGVYQPQTGLHLPANDVDRLEAMLLSMKDDQRSPSPEMQELNKSLDKLISLKNPAAVVDTPAVQSPALPVVIQSPGADIGSIQRTVPAKARFYDIESNAADEQDEEVSLIAARLSADNMLSENATVSIELETDVAIQGRPIPSGTLLSGTCHLSGNRMLIHVSSIRYKQQLLPVALEAIGMDGLAGIDASRAQKQQYTRDWTGQSLTSVGPTYLDGSVSGQAASSGIQLARSLASRKVREVKVPVKKGFQIFLRDTSKK